MGAATSDPSLASRGHVLDEWISAVKDELGIDLDVDTGGQPVTPVQNGHFLQIRLTSNRRF